MKLHHGKQRAELDETYKHHGTFGRHAAPRAQSHAASLPERTPFTWTLASYWRFLVAGLANLVQTGAVVPSQRFLINRMLAPIPEGYDGEIVELGAGTGALTRRLAAKCPAARIVACEINPVLARDLGHSLGTAGLLDRVQIVSDSAERLLSGIALRGNAMPEFILSGIPLGNLDRETVLALVGRIRAALAPRGMYIQFQHSLMDRKKIKATFARLRTVPVFLNFPPAVIYYARKS
jgi:phosphatidylethanolamine/phosphatidyl-N-methylethanolamine N-methyltransferase